MHAASIATTATTTATALTTAAAEAAATAANTTAATTANTPATTTSRESYAPGFEDSNSTKKFKRLPNFAAFFMRKNEMTKGEAAKKKHIDNEAVAAGNTAAAQFEGTDGNDNEPKEDNQLVYAELVLKPAQHNEPLPPKNSTEYAEIVYVQKKNPEVVKK